MFFYTFCVNFFSLLPGVVENSFYNHKTTADVCHSINIYIFYLKIKAVVASHRVAIIALIATVSTK